jgi:hypothetical protein
MRANVPVLKTVKPDCITLCYLDVLFNYIRNVTLRVHKFLNAWLADNEYERAVWVIKFVK